MGASRKKAQGVLFLDEGNWGVLVNVNEEARTKEMRWNVNNTGWPKSYKDEQMALRNRSPR